MTPKGMTAAKSREVAVDVKGDVSCSNSYSSEATAMPMGLVAQLVSAHASH